MTALIRNIHIQRAAQALACGGIVAYPTEAVWGLGVDPNNIQAIQNLLHLKKRPRHKGLILLAANIEQVEPWLRHANVEQRQRLEQSWPGPTTWLLPNHKLASAWVVGDFQSVAIRVTNHPVAAALCEAFGGPIISTSANISGALPARQAWCFGRDFRRQLSAVVPGKCGREHRPTEIRDLLTNQVYRES